MMPISMREFAHNHAEPLVGYFGLRSRLWVAPPVTRSHAWLDALLRSSIGGELSYILRMSKRATVALNSHQVAPCSFALSIYILRQSFYATSMMWAGVNLL